MRGIVLEISEGRALVMKNSGLPGSVPAKPGWQVGDVVSVPGRAVPFGALASIAAALVLVAGLLFAGHSLYSTPTTLVSIDVNPSIELSLNRFDRVVAAQGLNPEAEEVLAGLPLKGRGYAEALALLMDEGGLAGYLGEDAFLVFSLQSSNANRQDALLAGLQEAAGATVLSRHAGATVEYLLVDGQTVAEAHGHGMSAGKYMLVQELAALEPGLDVEAYTHHSVGDIQGEIEAHRHRYRGGSEGGSAEAEASQGEGGGENARGSQNGHNGGHGYGYGSGNGNGGHH